MTHKHAQSRSAVDLIKGHSGEVDLVDSLLGPVFSVCALVTVGVASFEVFGMQAAGTFFSLGATDLTFAFVLGVASLAIAAATNMPDTHKWTQWNWAIAGAGLAVMIGLEFMPELQSAATSNDYIAIGVFSLEAAMFYTVAYL